MKQDGAMQPQKKEINRKERKERKETRKYFSLRSLRSLRLNQILFFG
jgi:hypothetical protein